MKTIILILTLTFSLFAKYEWSEPVALTNDGNYPELGYWKCAITIDNNNMIYSFYVKDIEFDHLRWYSQIEYRTSTDGGLTWSGIINITPEYDFYRIIEIKAECDSQNNVHIVYLKGNGAPYEVLYKKFNGQDWTEPYLISDISVERLRLGIDRTDRLYVVWGVEFIAKYSYCQLFESVPLWTEVESINSDINLRLFDFVFDSKNNLHAIGTTDITGENKPVSFIFNREEELWNDFNVFDKYTNKAYGITLTISDKDSLYSNVMSGENSDYPNYIQSKSTTDSVWSDPVYINKNNSWDYRKMFVDSHDDLHLFEVNFDENASLSYSNNQNGSWVTDLFQTDPLYSFGQFDVECIRDDIFYLVYRKQDISTFSDNIYFQSKQIEVEIDDTQCLISDFILYQNYPNPFNNSTSIKYYIPYDCNVELSIFNSIGEKVSTFEGSRMKKGTHEKTFNADKLNSGVYYYRLVANGKVQAVSRMLYLK